MICLTKLDFCDLTLCRILAESGCSNPGKEYPDLLDYEMFGWENRGKKEDSDTTPEQDHEARKISEKNILKYETPDYSETNRIGKPAGLNHFKWFLSLK